MSDKKKKWSASKVTTFNSCKLKYLYTYINKWKSDIKVNTALADKGSAFHNTVEHYFTGEDKQEFKKRLQENIEKFHVNTTDPEKEYYFDYTKPTTRFFLFWDKFVAAKEKEGYKIGQEETLNGELNGEPFIGYIDLLIEGEDDLIIYDYKTAASGSASSYKDQLILYAYLIAMRKGWKQEDISKKIKLNIFFPFYKVQKQNLSEEDDMLSCVKELKYTQEDVDKVIQMYKSSINEEKITDWENVNIEFLGNVNYYDHCQYCPYLGSIPNEDGFQGCPASCKSGYAQPRNVNFIRP